MTQKGPTPAVFARDADGYLPLAAAHGPWNAGHLHGGPVMGLLTHLVQASVDDPSFRLSRITTDLHSPVPTARLTPVVTTIRRSKRLWLLQAVLVHEGSEVARTSALFLRSDAEHPTRLDAAHPPGPDGLPTRALFAGVDPAYMPPGFHTTVQTRWVPRAEHVPRAIWFRLPLPLIEGQPTSPLTAACALADFAAAAASIEAAEQGQGGVAYINTDCTLYLARPPQGEWFCVVADRQSEHDGINVIEVAHYDEHGRFGRSLQARLAQRFR
ncbi:MAG TPA: thioesterase family protein [Polyangiales bacterium]